MIGIEKQFHFYNVKDVITTEEKTKKEIGNIAYSKFIITN